MGLFKQKDNSNNKRRNLTNETSISSNQLHFRNPWIVLAWSITFPGFGHYMCGNYVFGFFLISFEFIVNTLSHINLSIYHTILGNFEKSKEVVNLNFAGLYLTTYIFAAYDSYRRAVENNRVYQLAYHDKTSSSPLTLSTIEINKLAKLKPWVAFVWSGLSPILGGIYIHRIPTVLFTFVWWGITLQYSHFLEGVFYTLLGDFDTARKIIAPQWFMFLPSIIGFSMYNSYSVSVENNKMYEIEKARYLKENYQKNDLKKLFE